MPVIKRCHIFYDGVVVKDHLRRPHLRQDNFLLQKALVIGFEVIYDSFSFRKWPLFL